jgi:hypothetical protein
MRVVAMVGSWPSRFLITNSLSGMTVVTFLFLHKRKRKEERAVRVGCVVSASLIGNPWFTMVSLANPFGISGFA